MTEHEDVAALLDTPWGKTSELRGRRLYPGAGTPPEEVARNQRERLFGAIVALASERGYEAITVADVLALSGVSRSAFYEHFANKAECLLEAASELVPPTLTAIEAAAQSNGDGPGRAAFEAFLALLRSQPAAARVWFVELHATGEAGEAVSDRGTAEVAAFFDAMDEAPWADKTTVPDLVQTLVAGLRKLIHTRLARREEVELETLWPQLWEWLEIIVPPPGPLAVPRRQRVPMPARFEGYTPAERIARAVAAVVAEKGYGAMSTNDVAARASISLSTFYAHFADKRDAILAALEMGGAQVTALAVPAARRAGSWQESVRVLYEAICAYFVAEPEMAQLTLVGVYGAGPRALARRDRMIDSLAAMLAPGFEENPEAPTVSSEAIAATVYALMRDQVRREGPESIPAIVPLATYLTLVGFVGPDRALAVANRERSTKR